MTILGCRSFDNTKMSRFWLNCKIKPPYEGEHWDFLYCGIVVFFVRYFGNLAASVRYFVLSIQAVSVFIEFSTRYWGISPVLRFRVPPNVPLHMRALALLWLNRHMRACALSYFPQKLQAACLPNIHGVLIYKRAMDLRISVYFHQIKWYIFSSKSSDIFSVCL